MRSADFNLFKKFFLIEINIGFCFPAIQMHCVKHAIIGKLRFTEIPYSRMFCAVISTHHYETHKPNTPMDIKYYMVKALENLQVVIFERLFLLNVTAHRSKNEAFR